MKKIYVKPSIEFESLELSSNIAAGCGFINKDSSFNDCPIYDPETHWHVFMGDMPNCVQTPPGVHDEVCYHVSLESNNVFTS